MSKELGHTIITTTSTLLKCQGPIRVLSDFVCFMYSVYYYERKLITGYVLQFNGM